MSAPVQIDYEALANQARTRVPSAAPKKAAKPAVDYEALATQARQTSAPAAPPQDFTTNSVNPATGTGYGLYRMTAPGTSQKAGEYTEISVPYNRVQDAQGAGYKLHPDEAPRYQHDFVHEGQAPSPYERVKSLLTRMTEPMADTPVSGTPVQQVAASLSNVGKIPFNVANRAVRGVIGLPQGVAQTAVDVYHGNPEGLDPVAMAEPSYQGFGEDAANLGPMAALGNLGGDAATMYAAGELGGRVGEVGSKVARGGKNAVEGFARAVTDTGKGPVRRLVKETQAANEKIDASNKLLDPAHLANTQNALHDMRGRELGYLQDVSNKAQEISQADQSEAASLTASRHAAEQKIAAANEAVLAKHRAAVQKVREANQAAENVLDLRRQHEQAAQQATADYYAKNDAADVRSKGEENSAWSSLWQKLRGKTIDGGQIVEPLKKIAASSPETAQFLRKLQGSPEDAPLDSLYAQDRAAIMKSQGYKGSYFDYPAPIRAQIDRIAASSGFEPDPIDFDPQAGIPIPVEQVHRASSILQGYIRDGRFNGNGPLRGEMKQLAKVLRSSVTRAAADAGASAELDAARNSTITRQGAFGKKPYSPSTTRTDLEKQANPDAFAQREEEKELARTYRYDPSLVDAYRKVKETREALAKLPAEDQLRKSLRQVPPPPTEGDTRPGFRLLASPKAAPARLTSGSPYERAVQAVTQPVRPEFPDRPVPTPRQTISSPDLVAARRAAAEARAGKAQTRGTWVATWPIFQAMRALWGGHIPSIPTMVLESAGTYATTRAATTMMRYPPMLRFLTEARPEDVSLIPPDLRGDLPGLVTLARRQGIRVAPALVAATAGMAGQQRQQGQAPLITPADAIQAMQPTPAGGQQ